jgi:hypothetical protein
MPGGIAGHSIRSVVDHGDVLTLFGRLAGRTDTTFPVHTAVTN